MRVAVVEVARAMTEVGFRVGPDDDPRARVFFLREDQHLAERALRRPAIGDRRIAAGLVDDQHIAGFGGAQGGVGQVVFRQMMVFQPLDAFAGAGKDRAVVQRVVRQDVFQVGRDRGIEMHAAPVEHQAQRRFAAIASRTDRPQEGVLDTQNGRVGRACDSLAARAGRAAPPDADQIAGPRFSDADVVARKCQNAADAALGQKPAVIDKNLLALATGPCVIAGPGHQFPARLFTEFAVPSVPVSAASVFCHCT